MLLFGRRRRPAPRDPHRRRKGIRAFWSRGNRRVGQAVPPDVADLGEASGPSAAPGDTLPTATSRPTPIGQTAADQRRDWLREAVRFCGALLVCALLCCGAYSGIHFVRHSHHFAVRDLRVSPTSHVTAAALTERANVALGENLFRVDLAAVQAALRGEPWLKSVRVRRELPATVVIDVVEYQPRALVALGALYLVDGDGVVFKRATPDESTGLAVITGIGRDNYITERAESQGLIREALVSLSTYQSGDAAHRAAIGEVHIDRFSGATLYTAAGLSIRLGRGTPDELGARLRRWDGVAAALQKTGERPAVVFLDNRAHPDQVTVRLEEPR